MSGLKPVVEIMFMDFVTFAMDAMVNQGAKAHFMFGGQCNVPMVLRTQHGGGLSAGPQHSQCLEAWFAHVPGLKVAVPSTVADAYALLRAAIEDPNPVIFVENKALYGTKGELGAKPDSVRLGSARLARPGKDATIVAYGAVVGLALSGADELARHGIDVEVIDLRSIQPWDRECVLASVRRTGRLVVAHEAVRDFGVGAEIAAFVGEHAFASLQAPVMRVGAEFSPVPFAPSLERVCLPTASRIADAVRNAMQYSTSTS